MRIRITLALCTAMLACEPSPDEAIVNADTETPAGDGTASFRMGNGEIRDDMMRMLDEAGIEYRLGDNNAIIYDLADGEMIDRIGNEAISEYITRN